MKKCLLLFLLHSRLMQQKRFVCSCERFKKYYFIFCNRIRSKLRLVVDVSAKLPARLQSRLKRLEQRIKRIEDILEISPTIVSFDWKDFSYRDRMILNILLEKGREGATTTQIAEQMGFDDPEGSGRVIVYRRLKRIERISRRIKGFSIVLYDHKRWSLNYDDFQFHVSGVEN